MHHKGGRGVAAEAARRSSPFPRVPVDYRDAHQRSFAIPVINLTAHPSFFCLLDTQATTRALADRPPLLSRVQSPCRHLRPSTDVNHAPDVSLADEDSGVVDGLCEAGLEDLGLEASLHEVLDLEGEYVIETHAGLVEYTDPHESSVGRGSQEIVMSSRWERAMV